MTRVRSYRVVLDRSVTSADPPPTTIHTPHDVVALVAPLTDDEPVEVFLTLLLDPKNRVQRSGILTISRGLLHTTLVHPREVFAPAIVQRAATVVLAHNHPSGDATPSPEDEEITTQLVAAGELLGIPVTDHVIVAPGGVWYSFRAANKCMAL